VWVCGNVNSIEVCKEELKNQISTSVFHDEKNLIVNVFQSELTMIKNFLAYISLEIDILTGYNSKKF
jgi:DNA polymerase elongation subunit (family B)